jgi:hypothetical protein
MTSITKGNRKFQNIYWNSFINGWRSKSAVPNIVPWYETGSNSSTTITVLGERLV